MAKAFDEAGVRFKYPDDWQLEHEETDTGWTATVQSPGSAFLMVCLREDQPDPARMADAALHDLREVYAGLEAEPVTGELAGRPAVGHDISFFSLDLINSCWTRCFESGAGTVLVLCQCEDHELPACEPAFRAVVASLEVDDDA